MSFEERARRLWAEDECEKLMSRYCYFMAMGRRREIMDRLWSKAEDSSYAVNGGEALSRAEVYEKFVLDYERAAEENYMILLASDRRLARVKDRNALYELRKPYIYNKHIAFSDDLTHGEGLFNVLGCLHTNITAGGRVDAKWFLQRYRASFVLEDGEWRIKRLYAATDAAGLMDEENWPLHPAELKPEISVSGKTRHIPFAMDEKELSFKDIFNVKD